MGRCYVPTTKKALSTAISEAVSMPHAAAPYLQPFLPQQHLEKGGCNLTVRKQLPLKGLHTDLCSAGLVFFKLV